ncbi:MAG TPA: hypothetical protein VGL38_01740 [bacterium]|jgi:hypothetical protein
MCGETKIPSSFEYIERAFESFYAEHPEALDERIREIGDDPKTLFVQIDSRVKTLVGQHVVQAAKVKKALFERVASRIRGRYDSLSTAELRTRVKAMFEPSQAELQPSFRDFERMDESTMRSMLEDADILRELERISRSESGE